MDKYKYHILYTYIMYTTGTYKHLKIIRRIRRIRAIEKRSQLFMPKDDEVNAAATFLRTESGVDSRSVLTTWLDYP